MKRFMPPHPPTIMNFFQPYLSIMNMIKSNQSLRPSGLDLTTILMISISAFGIFLIILFIVFLVLRSKKEKQENQNQEKDVKADDEKQTPNKDLNNNFPPVNPNNENSHIDESNRSGSRVMLQQGRNSNKVNC